jgi:2-aminoadipate transaminase
VSFVDGSAFYVGEGGQNQMRLSFSLYEPAEIAEGIRRLSLAIHQFLP